MNTRTISIPEPIIQGHRREWGIFYLFESTPVDRSPPLERRLLGLALPPWQRGEVWSLGQKTRFIEGIFLGLGAGYFVTNGCEWAEDGRNLPMSGWLLDGQQRIAAIRDFVQRDLAIFDGVRFADLDRATARRRFLSQPFPCFELDYTDDEEKLIELYDRLNFGGTPHGAADQEAIARALVQQRHDPNRVRSRPQS